MTHIRGPRAERRSVALGTGSGASRSAGMTRPTRVIGPAVGSGEACAPCAVWTGQWRRKPVSWLPLSLFGVPEQGYTSAVNDWRGLEAGLANVRGNGAPMRHAGKSQ